MAESYSIRPEDDSDHQTIDKLHQAAFGDEAVSALVRDLRTAAGTLPTVSLVAVSAEGIPLGHVMLSHAWLDTKDRLTDVMVLSPLAVAPDAQRKGLGTALINASIVAATGLSVPLVFLEGEQKYYRPRGFEQASSLGFRRPSLRIPESAFHVARLPNYDSAMVGTFVYRDVHWRHGVGLYR